MIVTRIGRLLLGLGVLVGTAAALGLLAGFEPARLPAAVLNIAVYKLLFVSALAILAAGAVTLRHAARTAGRARGPGPVVGGRPPAGLASASAPPSPLTPGEPAVAARDRAPGS